VSTGDPRDPIQSIRDYWDDRVSRCETDCARVESGVRGQRMRFASFLQMHDVGGCSVLDIGAGVGDLWGWFTQHGIRCEYHGIDVSQGMVERARARFPGTLFEVQDLDTWNPGRTFDFTVAFAIHNVRVDGADAILRRTLSRQFALCARAAHVSLLTDRYSGFADHIQAWRAEEILTLALSVTPYVVLRHDYLPNDFSATLYRQPLIDTRPDLID
jgi:SAM-dependent methyltransferase